MVIFSKLTVPSDIESMPFIEALVQYRHKVGRDNFFCINVTYVPV